MIKLIEEYDSELIQIANKTSRSKGASAINNGIPRSVVLSYVLHTALKTDSILDFGAGKDAIQSKYLKDNGFMDVTAYDFGSNLIDGLHDKYALDKKYDVVFASNVLNVSSTEDMLTDTIEDIWSAVEYGGRCIFNYPSSPRKANLKTKDVSNIISMVTGKDPIRVGGSSSTPIWEIYK